MVNDSFTVTEDGWVQQNGQNVARLGIAYAENPNLLTKTSTGLYQMDGGALPSAYANNQVAFSVKQGYIERSNVDAAETMTNMLTAYRSFEANQKYCKLMIAAWTKPSMKSENYKKLAVKIMPSMFVLSAIRLS